MNELYEFTNHVRCRAYVNSHRVPFAQDQIGIPSEVPNWSPSQPPAPTLVSKTSYLKDNGFIRTSNQVHSWVLVPPLIRSCKNWTYLANISLPALILMALGTGFNVWCPVGHHEVGRQGVTMGVILSQREGAVCDGLHTGNSRRNVVSQEDFWSQESGGLHSTASIVVSIQILKLQIES